MTNINHMFLFNKLYVYETICEFTQAALLSGHWQIIKRSWQSWTYLNLPTWTANSNGKRKEQEESVLNCLPVYQRSSRMTHTIWPWNGLFSSCRKFQTVKVLNDDSGWFTFRRAVPAHLGLCEAPPGLSPNLTVNMTLIQWLWMLSPQRKPFLRWLPTAASFTQAPTHTHTCT